jgi:pectate lyase
MRQLPTSSAGRRPRRRARCRHDAAVNLQVCASAALLTTVVACLGPSPSCAAALAAFPGCEGFGCDTPGGRGGKVIHVTNLNDAGDGSLRAALSAKGPRIVVFDTGGTITLRSSLRIQSPFVTVAGQTAPGGGIQLKLEPTQNSGLIDINTHDVVIRGMKLRQGAHAAVDAAIPLEATGANNVVIDHNSIYWATDENVTLYKSAKNVTVSWNIIAEGLSRSTHYAGEHSRGLFISGEDAGPTTAHHNLIAHNTRRSPEGSQQGVMDIRNNVIYNPGTHQTLISDQRANVGTNWVGNFYKPGPSTVSTKEMEGHRSGGPRLRLFADGNMRSNGRPARMNSVARRWLVSSPVPAPAVTTTSAEQAYLDVLAGAGARAQGVDAADARVLKDVERGTGRIIDDPSEVAGWPVLAPGVAEVDSDRDGMPDKWESARRLNPSVDDSAGDRDGNGWTNVEEYINDRLTLARPRGANNSALCHARR